MPRAAARAMQGDPERGRGHGAIPAFLPGKLHLRCAGQGTPSAHATVPTRVSSRSGCPPAAGDAAAAVQLVTRLGVTRLLLRQEQTPQGRESEQEGSWIPSLP